RLGHGIDSEQGIERHRLAFVLVLETGDVGIDELALAGDQHDGAGKLAVRDMLLERIMDAVELLLGHSHLLGWNLWQAHTNERGRERRQALILRPRLRPTDRSDERESASERGTDNCAIHCRLLPRAVFASASYRTARETSLLCCASLPARSGNGRAAWNDMILKEMAEAYRQGQHSVGWLDKYCGELGSPKAFEAASTQSCYRTNRSTDHKSRSSQRGLCEAVN